VAKLVGCVRVSSQDQEVHLQIDALATAGCATNMIFIDKISSVKAERPGLRKCLDSLASGDTLLIWRLDRLSRYMVHLVQLIEDLYQKSIGFRSLCDRVIDMKTFIVFV